MLTEPCSDEDYYKVLTDCLDNATKYLGEGAWERGLPFVRRASNLGSRSNNPSHFSIRIAAEYTIKQTNKHCQKEIKNSHMFAK